jgi:hypothetical protein
MSNYRVLFKRVIARNGQAIAEAQSQVITSNVSDSTVTQSVTVHVSASSSSSLASSSSSTRGRIS